MTEEEAKTKWCPFVRITPETDNYNPITNRNVGTGDDDTDMGKEVCCIGSRCMAWRWAPVIPAFAPETHAIIDTPWKAADANQTDGYCGLVGKP